MCIRDSTFNTAGWHNSYDGLPFAADEMRDWQQRTVDRILSTGPERVFEVGSGTGLVLFGVAPKVAQYRAIDEMCIRDRGEIGGQDAALLGSIPDRFD